MERTRKVVKFSYGTRCYSVHWTCFLLPLTITVDSTFVAGHATKVTATRLLFYVVPVHGTSRKITKEFHGGNPTGSAVKTNGREGIRESGSSMGCPEVGLANDSWELSTQNKKTGECRVRIVQVLGLSVENCTVSARRNSTQVHITWHNALNDGQRSDNQPEGSSKKYHGRWPQNLPGKVNT